jgi:hypothetical protein
MGPYAKVDYNSLHLKIVNAEVSYPPPFQRERSGVGADLSYGMSTFASLLIPKQPIGKGRVRRRGKEGEKADMVSELT